MTNWFLKVLAWLFLYCPQFISVALSVAAVHQWRKERLRWGIPLAVLVVFCAVVMRASDVAQYVLLAPLIASLAALGGNLLRMTLHASAQARSDSGVLSDSMLD